MTEQILFDREGDWGVVTLNNEAALNALNWDMVKAMRAQLTEWAARNDVKAVLVKANGERAFCAGGDIRWLYDNGRKDPVGTSEFFREEYRNNSLIYHFPKPYVSLINGVVMGGGVGISVHGDFRVAGDETLFAMPETGIGLFPDVGGGHFMPRLHEGLGLYYALTGARAKAADCMAAGIATHYTPTEKHGELVKALLGLSLSAHAHADIEAVLDVFAADPGHAGVNDIRRDVARFFEGPESLAQLIDALRADEGVFATKTTQTLERMSPTSMAITFEQMKRGRTLDFDDTMIMEFRMVCRVMEGSDFFEGVRAQIIDKDRNPQWAPARLSDLNDADTAAYFEPLGDRDLTLP